MKPHTEDDELDGLFNKTINAKQIAVDVAQQENEFADNKELADIANKLLEQYRKEFKSTITTLRLKDREIFIPIKGFEGLYEVSNTGRVRSLRGGKRSGKELKTVPSPLMYMRVSLCKDGKTYNHWVHRLVAISFISNPLNKPEVNHLDGNPANNDVSNLEWATRSEQELHAYSVLGKTTWNKGRFGVRANKTRAEAEALKQLLGEGSDDA